MFTAAVCSQVSTQWAGLAFSEQQGCFHEYLPGVSPPRRSLQWFGGEMHKDKAGRNIRRCGNSYVDKTTGQDISWLGLFPLSAEPDPNEDLHITCDDIGFDSSSCTTTPSPAGVTDTTCHEHKPSPKAIRRQLVQQHHPEPRQGPYGGSSGSSARIPVTRVGHRVVKS